MADNTEAVISIRTVGGDQAASEIDKATNALNRTASSSANLQNRFQERFQHIGLKIFAGDALRASGLGKETRAVIGTLNLALTAGAEAAGIASGGITLVIAALTALAGIVMTVIEHHKSHVEALQKLEAQQKKDVEGTDKIIESLTKYRDAVGGLDTSQQKLLDTTKALNAVQAQMASSTAGAMLGALEKQQVSIKDTIATLEVQLRAIETLRASNAEYSQQGTMANIRMTASVNLVNEKLDKQKLALAQVSQGIAKTVDQIRAYGGLAPKEYDKATEAALAAAKKQKEYAKGLQEAVDAAFRGSQESHQRMLDGEAAMTEYADKQQEKQLQKWVEQSKSAIDFVGNSFGTATARMLVEGKDFTEEMSKAFTNMAEHIIEKIIQMIAEWAIFTALSGFGGPVGMIGAAGLKSSGFAMAEGGTVRVDQPTLFMAGEAGPEMASFTPLSRMGGSTGGGGGGGGDIHIGSINTTVQGVQNTDQIAREVGLKIVQQIRGQGQLDFTRS